MFKTEIKFSCNTLYINVEGKVNSESIQKLKKKLYYLIEEYNIYDIVIDTKRCLNIDKDLFNSFFDDYDISYGGNLIVMDK